MLNLLFFIAQEGGNGTSGGGGSSLWSMLIIFGGMIALLYFLLIRPQNRRIRSQMELIEGTRVGDEIVTSSGIYGFVTELEDDTLLIEVSEGVEIRIAKNAIARNLTAAERKKEEDKEEKEETAEETEETEETDED